MTSKIEKFTLKQAILFLRTLGLRKNISLDTHSLSRQSSPQTGRNRLLFVQHLKEWFYHDHFNHNH